MSFFFANPWGLLALSAIPAIVAIHSLQEPSRLMRASTLFLLERARPTGEGGVRLVRFQHSLPFWMQILAACALAWLLAEPRWVRAEPRQTVAVVLDSSASMQAFRQETLAALRNRLRQWSQAARRTDWHLVETGPRRPPLYAGPSLDGLLEAAENGWQPVLGSHPFTDAVMAARVLAAAPSGGVILVTDRSTDVPADVAVLSVAEPQDNVGFSGGRVAITDGQARWRAMVTNHSDTPQARELTLRDAGSGDLAAGQPLAPPQTIELAAGQSSTFSAAWPADATERIVLSLTADALPIDDTLPLVRPAARRVRLANRLSGSVGDLLVKMLTAADGVELVIDGSQPDLVVDALGSEPGLPAVLTAVAAEAASKATEANPPGETAAERRTFDPAWVAAEDHPLVRDLGWGSLLSGPAGEAALSASDTPLLWKDGRPLAFLRPTPPAAARAAASLVLNWNLDNSTAGRTAAVVVLIARFVDEVRRQIPRSWAENFETGQAIPLPAGRQQRAPETPGFFTLPITSQNFQAAAADVDSAGESGPLLTAAAQFADARECDLGDAMALDTLDAIRLERVMKRSVEDPWAPLWIVVAAAALLAAWSSRRRA